MMLDLGHLDHGKADDARNKYRMLGMVLRTPATPQSYNDPYVCLPTRQTRKIV